MWPSPRAPGSAVSAHLRSGQGGCGIPVAKSLALYRERPGAVNFEGERECSGRGVRDTAICSKPSASLSMGIEWLEPVRGAAGESKVGNGFSVGSDRPVGIVPKPKILDHSLA